MSPSFSWLALCVIVCLAVQTQTRGQQASGAADARAAAFIAEHEAKIRPLEIAVNQAWWKANVSGDDKDFAAKEAAQNTLDAALSDAARFAELKSLHDAKLADPIVAREIQVMYSTVLGEAGAAGTAQEDLGADARPSRRRLTCSGPKWAIASSPTARSRRCSPTRRIRRSSRRRGKRASAVGPAVVAHLKALGGAAERSGPDARLQELPRDAALPERAEPGGSAQAIRPTRRPDARAVRSGQGRDRCEAGGAVRRCRRRTAAVALSGSILPGGAGGVRHEPGRDFRVRSTRARSPSCARSSTRGSGCRSTTCWRTAICTSGPASRRTPSAPTSTARATCGCWPTSCPTRSGWARCSMSWATRCTRARTSRRACPTCCGWNLTS